MALGNKLSAKNYSLWRKVRAKVIARDNGICQYCGEEGDQVDHVVSRKRGGDDSLDNLLCCCRACNLRKSSSDLSVFLERAHTRRSRLPDRASYEPRAADVGQRLPALRLHMALEPFAADRSDAGLE